MGLIDVIELELALFEAYRAPFMAIGFIKFHLDRLESHAWVAGAKAIGQHRRELVKEMGCQGFAGGRLLGSGGEAIVVVQIAVGDDVNTGSKRVTNLDHIENHAVLGLPLNHGFDPPAMVMGCFADGEAMGRDEFEVKNELAPHVFWGLGLCHDRSVLELKTSAFEFVVADTGVVVARAGLAGVPGDRRELVLLTDPVEDLLLGRWFVVGDVVKAR